MTYKGYRKLCESSFKKYKRGLLYILDAVNRDVCEEYGGYCIGGNVMFDNDNYNERIMLHVHANRRTFSLYVNGVLTRLKILIERLDEIVTAFKRYGEAGLKESMYG